jgi:hypothetical protein
LDAPATPGARPPAGRPAGRMPEAALALVCALAFLLNVPVFASRLGSLLDAYRLDITEGCEGPSIYSVWKAQNGHALYERPDKDTYTITCFNFLFYRSYALLLDLAGSRDGDLLFYGRFITLAFGALGVAGHWLLIRRVSGPAPGPTAWLATAVPVVLAWFGTNFMAWWVLAIRPDVAGAALVTWALLAYLWAADRRSPAGMALASAAFFLGWAFKQSLVWTFFSACLYTLVRLRSWRLLLPLAIPCGLAMAATYAYLGDPYWVNTIVAPAMSQMSVKQSALIFARIFFQNGFYWLFWLVPLLMPTAAGDGEAAGTGTEGAGLPDRGRGFLHMALAITFVYGIVALGRAGSNKNHIIEAFLIAATLSVAALRRILARGHGRPRDLALAAAAALMVPMALFPAAQLARPHALGRITLADGRADAVRAALAEDVDRLEKPVLIFDDILSQPWHATGGEYPAFVADSFWYWEAKSKGFLQEGGAESLIRRHAFRSLLLDNSMVGEMRAARESGYREAPDQPAGIRAAGLKLLVPGGAGPPG